MEHVAQCPQVTGRSDSVSAEEIRSILRETLLARVSDPAVSATAVALLPSVSAWFRPNSPDGEAAAERFAAGLGRKLSGLGAFLEGMTSSVPPESSLAKWRKTALSVADLWHEDLPEQRQKIAAKLTQQRNPIWLAAVVDTLLETSADATATASLLRNLREKDAGEFARCSLPPGIGVPWESTAYLFPERDQPLFLNLRRVFELGETKRKESTVGSVEAARISSEVDALLRPARPRQDGP